MSFPNLTPAQLATLKWIVDSVQSGKLEEEFRVHWSNRGGLIGTENDVVSEGMLTALENEGLIRCIPGKGVTTVVLTAAAYEATGIEAGQGSDENPDATTVWVVHGRDGAARNAMFGFLRAAGLRPLEWSEAVAHSGEAAPHISTVLTTAFARARAVVVLLTGDDLARLRDELLAEGDPDYEKEFTPQARPNVLFEAGLSFGSHPARTVLVQIGRVRPFSDIAGRHVLHMDNSPEKRQELISRLKVAGCSVTEAGTDWLAAGDFESSLIDDPPLSQPVARGQPPAKSTRPSSREAEILVALARADEDYVSEEELASTCEINRHRLRYHIERLENGGFVSSGADIDGSPHVSLSQGGRTYLVRTGRV